MRDPYILESPPGRFVLFGTTDENLWGGPATGFDCYSSTDCENWDGPTAAFRPPVGFWADTQFWAPEVHQYDGRYFLFATFANSDPEARPRGTAILVSDEATGPYRPWSDGPVTPPDIPCLDGTLFVDDSGPWIVYSRGAEGVRGEPGISDGEMWARRLTSDLRAASGAPVLLFTASTAPWSKPLSFPDGVEPPEELNLGPNPLFTDGPFLLRTPGDRLLMLWSSFGDEGYAMGVARSESNQIAGPWTQSEHPLWARNGGHGMILSAPNCSHQLVFHWPNDTPNERVKLVPVEITTDDVVLVDSAGREKAGSP